MFKLMMWEITGSQAEHAAANEGGSGPAKKDEDVAPDIPTDTPSTRTAPTVMVIPSAGLTSKIKGKHLQYRGQADKDTGKKLYHKFVTLMRSLGSDLVAGVDPNKLAKQMQKVSLDESDSAPVPTENDVATGGVRVIGGTFGNRQGLEMTSECGPFTHMFEF